MLKVSNERGTEEFNVKSLREFNKSRRLFILNNWMVYPARCKIANLWLENIC